MSAPVTSRREGALLYVGLARPEKRNAIHRELLLALVDAVAAAEREPDVRAVVLYGEGPVFSAGVDFGMLAGDVAGERALPFRTLVGDMQAALSRLEAIEKPVIAALHRYVPGLGLELALACDLRVATADCELGLPEVRVGLVPDVGGTTRLVRTVGYAKAKELILTGRMIGAAEALSVGLVNQVVPPGEHLAAAARLAEEIAANAPLAVGLAKRLVDLGSNVDKQTFLAMELLAQSVLLQTEDAREGARALAARRPPRFTGR
jgi:enoyl-CoA hydratase/carnithine racemase